MRKILIANRGEIACRILRGARALGLETVAVYSEADADSLHVALADEAYPIGPAPARDSYLAAERILEAARLSKAEAVHPGYGFLSENPNFAQAVMDRGLTWIGPHPRTIADMGDKERARHMARRVGVPVLGGSPRFAEGDLAGLVEAAERVGFPVVVKAAAGGGGIGMQPARSPDELLKLAPSIQAVAKRVFGDGAIYVEHFIPTARHVEIQVFGFGDGQAVHLHERDCSIQRRFQKIIEEAPAPALLSGLRQEMTAVALALCRHQGYAGAGTVEFILDVDTHAFFFLEMNTRIQVEHAVSEMTTGLDLIAMQIDFAGDNLPAMSQSDIRQTGHAIECRLYAENPKRNFFPSPGRLKVFRLPEPCPSIRIETGYRQGDTITPHYDPLIAKVICHGASREEAIGTMTRALESTRIDGLSTNVDFLSRVLLSEAFRTGLVSTRFVEQHGAELLT